MILRHLPLVLGLAAAVLLPAAAPVAAQPVAAPRVTAGAADEPLALEAAVRTGRLANGLTYYIRRNAEPRARAEMYLAINAGAAMEDDDQRGLAHMIEHMLFNGTTRFPKMDLVQFLERTGMRFGGDVNAYTSFDETVYTLTVPTDSARLFDRAFDVLEDWAGAATLSGEEIDRERGVIIEEWRSRTQSAQGRVSNRLVPALLPGSRYADRLPIGDTAIIRRAPHEALRRFYRDWYRPDLMAIVVVGDIDPSAVEARIRGGMSDLRNPATPRPRPTIPTPARQGTEYVAVTDAEYPQTSVQIISLAAAAPTRTAGDLRGDLVSALVSSMMNQRLSEMTRTENAPFLGAFVGQGGLVRPAETFTVGAAVDPDRVEAGLAALLREGERVRRHGFTAGELSRQKADLLRGYERRYNERERTPSAALAREYVALFLSGEAAPGAEAEYRLAERLLPTITLDDISAEARRHFQPPTEAAGRLVVFAGIDRPDVAELDDAGLRALEQRLARAITAETIAPYEDRAVASALLDRIPAPVAAVSSETVAEIGTTVLRLANGVRVVVKPTTFKADEVRMTMTSPGGASRVSDADHFAATVAGAIAGESGVAGFSKDDLGRLLAGKSVSASAGISDVEESLNGSAAPADLETMFQLVHLRATAPRFDEGALAAFQTQQRAFLASIGANPAGALQDTLQRTLFGDHPRRLRFAQQLAAVNALTTAQLGRVYRDRFADLSDATFTVVGATDVPTVTRLAETYLATLPGGGRDDAWRDVFPDLPNGTIEKAVYKGAAPQSQVILLFHGDFASTPETRRRIDGLAGVMSIRLREKIREELGGVYGIQAQAVTTERPDAVYQFIVAFTCDPQRVGELSAAVRAEIAAVIADGPSEAQVSTVQEQARRGRQTALEQNPFWLSLLDDAYTWGGTPPAQLVSGYDALVAGMTAQTVKADAARYLGPSADLVRVVLYPESMAPAGR